eukprot:gnl/TRDRNA2_/TRDRNA2_95294_c0_seq2.p1 gnl/TRDRNA2_/TRDRNA2_95294_c0~~gnl/TRDRNA2_/TRDRNA2_95294_c0_seq2.p1  ORF type:complete len:122 (+),score=6.50 gnl/TRDRNA2_/TRDRNA2_95294_c0_seq2:231-596(+)
MSIYEVENASSFRWGKICARTRTKLHPLEILCQHLVKPTQVLTQNFEWVKLRPGSGTYFAPPERARILHLVNTHALRCHRRGNKYGSAGVRQPCTMPDHGLRWAMPELVESDSRFDQSWRT